MTVTVTLNPEANTITVYARVDRGVVEDIYIDTQRTFVCENEHSETASKIENIGIEEVTQVFDLNNVISGALATADINNDLFFVYVYGGGEQSMVMKYNDEYMSNKLLDSIYYNFTSTHDCESSCTDICNMIVLTFAFSIATTYREKIYYWEMLHDPDNSRIKCSCDGNRK